MGITRNAYGLMERDSQDAEWGASIPELSGITELERCFIARRRSGLTQEECAARMGITRFWFNQMETGKISCADLSKFWESQR